jgi:hypothetical protein
VDRCAHRDNRHEEQAVLTRFPCLAVFAAAVFTMAACSMTGPGHEAPSLPPDAVPARLILDDELCRNSGTVDAFDIVWNLADPAPRAWRDARPRDGHVTRLNADDALFIAHDGTQLKVTTGDRSLVCLGW